MRGLNAEKILEFFYPSRAKCLGCGDEQGCDEPFLCSECIRLLKPSNVLVNYGSRTESSLDSVLFVYFYGRPVKGLIRAFKFSSVKMLSSFFAPSLADLLAERAAETPDVIVPVPLHSARRFERGFNQAELLGERLSARTGIPMRTDLLRRIRRTKQQSKLKPSKRGGDLSGAFRACGDLSGLRVLLIDDVITTGSTARACASALKAAGAAEVHAISVAGSRRLRPSGQRVYHPSTKSNSAVKI